MRLLGINLTKDVKVFYIENYKMLLKKKYTWRPERMKLCDHEF